MTKTYANKMTVEEIRNRFENDVERFTKLETGQTSIPDAALMMSLITRAACVTTPGMKHTLDIGCGAGNNTLKLLQSKPNLNCDLLDLSANMLTKARERVSAVTDGEVTTHRGDFRELPLKEESYDIIMAAAVLHHLRDEEDWERAFSKLYEITAPGGSVWISDLISHESPHIQEIMESHYSDYLISVDGEGYRDKVLAAIEMEDTPRPLTFQLDLLKKVGFSEVVVLHKTNCFAAFGAIKE
ncbi:MAG: class I SAM-dependent methyltransferase [Spirochaetales bacterium]|nr:class I SAM-dependent methyltransferase [Spirochaetales bacterium]